MGQEKEVGHIPISEQPASSIVVVVADSNSSSANGLERTDEKYLDEEQGLLKVDIFGFVQPGEGFKVEVKSLTSDEVWDFTLYENTLEVRHPPGIWYLPPAQNSLVAEFPSYEVSADSVTRVQFCLPSEIEVQVNDSIGNPIAEAFVSLEHNEANFPFLSKGYTDSRGRAVLERVPGEQKLEVSHVNFLMDRSFFSISSASLVTISLIELQGETKTILVFDVATNNPIPDATIEVDSLPSLSIQTDSKGEAQIPLGGEDFHSVQVRRLGYVPASYSVRFEKDFRAPMIRSRTANLLILAPDRSPISFARVLLKGNSDSVQPYPPELGIMEEWRTVSDDGTITLSPPESYSAMIQVSAIGYKSRELKWDPSSSPEFIPITLVPDHPFSIEVVDREGNHLAARAQAWGFDGKMVPVLIQASSQEIIIPNASVLRSVLLFPKGHLPILGSKSRSKRFLNTGKDTRATIQAELGYSIYGKVYQVNSTSQEMLFLNPGTEIMEVDRSILPLKTTALGWDWSNFREKAQVKLEDDGTFEANGLAAGSYLLVPERLVGTSYFDVIGAHYFAAPTIEVPTAGYLEIAPFSPTPFRLQVFMRNGVPVRYFQVERRGQQMDGLFGGNGNGKGGLLEGLLFEHDLPDLVVRSQGFATTSLEMAQMVQMNDYLSLVIYLDPTVPGKISVDNTTSRDLGGLDLYLAAPEIAWSARFSMGNVSQPIQIELPTLEMVSLLLKITPAKSLTVQPEWMEQVELNLDKIDYQPGDRINVVVRPKSNN